MKIVSWNCNGALRRKLDAADKLDADILVVQECEDPVQTGGAYRAWAGEHVWAGYGKNKGIGIFPRKGHRVERLDWPGREFELFLPALVDGQLKIVGVWTQNCKPASHSYIGQFWHFLQANIAEIDERTIILGDFNSNSIWDKPRRSWNHTDCVNALKNLGLQSLYHHGRDEAQGSESEATFYFYRKPDKPFHIDYAFAHSALAGEGSLQLTIGSPEEWLLHSDHMPLIVET